MPTTACDHAARRDFIRRHIAIEEAKPRSRRSERTRKLIEAAINRLAADTANCSCSVEV